MRYHLLRPTDQPQDKGLEILGGDIIVILHFVK